MGYEIGSGDDRRTTKFVDFVHREWIKARDELTEKLRAALNTMFRDSYKSDTCLLFHC